MECFLLGSWKESISHFQVHGNSSIVIFAWETILRISLLHRKALKKCHGSQTVCLHTDRWREKRHGFAYSEKRPLIFFVISKNCWFSTVPYLHLPSSPCVCVCVCFFCVIQRCMYTHICSFACLEQCNLQIGLCKLLKNSLFIRDNMLFQCLLVLFSLGKSVLLLRDYKLYNSSTEYYMICILHVMHSQMCVSGMCSWKSTGGVSSTNQYVTTSLRHKARYKSCNVQFALKTNVMTPF